MEIKGSAVKPTINFVKNNFPNRYLEWLEILPVESQNIFKKPIVHSEWYPIHESTITPVKMIGKMFYNNVKDAAHEMGRYSAEVGLKGVYKIFVRISTPKFIISRAGNIFASYFKPSKINIEIIDTNIVALHVYKFTEKEDLMLYRIAGWIQRALEITNCKKVVTNVEKHTEESEIVYKITASWS